MSYKREKNLRVMTLTKHKLNKIMPSVFFRSLCLGVNEKALVIIIIDKISTFFKRKFSIGLCVHIHINRYYKSVFNMCKGISMLK